MKPRRVMLALEVETDAPLALLRDARRVLVEVLSNAKPVDVYVYQAQANVIKPAPKKVRKRR